MPKFVKAPINLSEQRIIRNTVYMQRPDNDSCFWVQPELVDIKLSQGWTLANPKLPEIKKELPKQGTTRVREIKDRHKGQSVWILGAGHSNTPQLIQRLIENNAIVIGVNQVYYSLPNAGYCPEYLVHIDVPFGVSTEDAQGRPFDVKSQLIRMAKAGTQHFIPDESALLYAKDFNSAAKYYTFKAQSRVDFQTEFLSDDILTFAHGNTAVFVALQIAYIFGAGNIILAGVDLWTPISPRSKNFMKMHCYDNERTDKTIVKNFNDRHFRVYQKNIEEIAKPALEEKGVKVFNISKQSKLECFPKISIDDALNLAGCSPGLTKAAADSDPLLPPPGIKKKEAVT